MKILDDYKRLEKEIYAYFGYEPEWRVYPITDDTDYFWAVFTDGNYSEVRFADSEEELKSSEGNSYVNSIIRVGVYRGAEYTMLVVDTHTDGNEFLQILANDKERPFPDED